MPKKEVVVTAQDVLEITPRLNRWAEAAVAQTQNGVRLSLRQLSALRMIEDEQTTLGEVARKLMVTPAVVTGLIDRLEKRGYARRINSTGDRRRIFLALTKEGHAAVATAEKHLVDELAARLDSLSKDDLASVQRAFAALGPVVTDLESKTPVSKS